MANFTKIFCATYTLIFLSGCLSIGSGPLTNSISLPLGQTNINHKLPSGFCLDKSANSSTAYQETMVVTNCIAVSNGNKSYFSRRPVDTIVNIAFTRSVVPKNISQQKYLSVIARNMEFKKFLTASSNKKIVYGEKKLLKEFFHVSFQRISSSNRREFIRKYFFFVDKKLVVMTILSFQKPRKNTYRAFEAFIAKLS
ncbi:hypothetical protein OA340_01260 [Paracoccaceae bacterium]|nr:hypothetical protein [Paracoccaceae bacterium]